MHIVDRHLTHAQRTTFASRQAEHDSLKHVYCANVRCRRFLGPRDTRVPVSILACPSMDCGTRTCARCRMYVAPGVPRTMHECVVGDLGHPRAPPQFGNRVALVRCRGCAQLIERHSGPPRTTCAWDMRFCDGYHASMYRHASDSLALGGGVDVDIGANVPDPEPRLQTRLCPGQNPALWERVIACGLHAQARRRNGPFHGPAH